MRLRILDQLSNHPDEFSVDCPECRGAIEVPEMRYRDGRSEADKLPTSGNHLSMYRVECVHCGWEQSFVFPMPGS